MLVQKNASKNGLTVRMDEEAVRYFSELYQSFLNKGATARFCSFVVMIVALRQVGCTQETIEKLCIQGKFASWKELVDARYEFSDYRDLNIPLKQALLLVEKIGRPVKTVSREYSDESLLYSISAA